MTQEEQVNELAQQFKEFFPGPFGWRIASQLRAVASDPDALAIAREILEAEIPDYRMAIDAEPQ
jgi:hypothetical protein